jgi:hypothetical protein
VGYPGDVDAWLTVEQISVRFGIKKSYAYRLASLHRWQRQRCRDRRVRYNCVDVEATLQRRR